MKMYMFALLLFSTLGLHAQNETPVFSNIDNVITVLYDVISGPAGERDWELFHSLFHEKALMGNTGLNKAGEKIFVHFTPEGYIEKNGSFFKSRGFFEEEINRVTNVYGCIAQVFTSYQFKFEKEGDIVQRGINSIQLIFEKDRWYVTQIIWQSETPNLPIPKKFLK